jgi:hypothetical protein
MFSGRITQCAAVKTTTFLVRSACEPGKKTVVSKENDRKAEEYTDAPAARQIPP